VHGQPVLGHAIARGRSRSHATSYTRASRVRSTSTGWGLVSN
jgi:hypothetical protein